MRNKLVKIALAASILLALTFTFSCSDDDKKEDPTWIPCDQAMTLYAQCSAAYGTEYAACDGDETCEKQATANQSKCMASACNGTSDEECMAYYMKECMPK